MKALVRGDEVILEEYGLDIDWPTGAPYTNKKYYGGPYTLIDEYRKTDELTVYSSMS